MVEGLETDTNILAVHGFYNPLMRRSAQLSSASAIPCLYSTIFVTTPAPARSAACRTSAFVSLSAPRVIEIGIVMSYSTIFVTTPAPTVRPPSRMAKRTFSSMAIADTSSTSIATLSPGITISVPAGSVTTPVTSVVRK